MDRALGHLDADEQQTMLARMRLMLATPALRARSWEHKTADEQLITRALTTHPGHKENDLTTRVLAAAAVAALTTAITIWAQNNGEPDLAALLNQAFDAFQTPATREHPSSESAAG